MSKLVATRYGTFLHLSSRYFRSLEDAPDSMILPRSSGPDLKPLIQQPALSTLTTGGPHGVYRGTGGGCQSHGQVTPFVMHPKKCIRADCR